MAEVIGIMGESGSGKSTSLRTLDPASTLIIDADKKGLPWRGWRQQYGQQYGNYIKTDDSGAILRIMAQVSLDEAALQRWCTEHQVQYQPMSQQAREWAQRIRVVVIDTLNGCMVGQEMRDIKITGYGKWSDLAQSAWKIVDYALDMRDDLIVIIICHSETITDDAGKAAPRTRIKANGRKLEKIILESKMRTVLMCECVGGEYRFVTRRENTSCKAPLGAFDAETIPNDISIVLQALSDF